MIVCNYEILLQILESILGPHLLIFVCVCVLGDFDFGKREFADDVGVYAVKKEKTEQLKRERLIECACLFDKEKTE